MALKKDSIVEGKLKLQVELGENSALPYVAVEFFQLSQFSSEFTLSCFPLDYQAVINTRLRADKEGLQVDDFVSIKTAPIFKMILSSEALKRLAQEIDNLTKNLKEPQK